MVVRIVLISLSSKVLWISSTNTLDLKRINSNYIYVLNLVNSIIKHVPTPTEVGIEDWWMPVAGHEKSKRKSWELKLLNLLLIRLKTFFQVSLHGIWKCWTYESYSEIFHLLTYYWIIKRWYWRQNKVALLEMKVGLLQQTKLNSQISAKSDIRFLRNNCWKILCILLFLPINWQS